MLVTCEIAKIPELVTGPEDFRGVVASHLGELATSDYPGIVIRKTDLPVLETLDGLDGMHGYRNMQGKLTPSREFGQGVFPYHYDGRPTKDAALYLNTFYMQAGTAELDLVTPIEPFWGDHKKLGMPSELSDALARGEADEKFVLPTIYRAMLHPGDYAIFPLFGPSIKHSTIHRVRTLVKPRTSLSYVTRYRLG